MTHDPAEIQDIDPYDMGWNDAVDGEHDNPWPYPWTRECQEYEHGWQEWQKRIIQEAQSQRDRVRIKRWFHVDLADPDLTKLVQK